VFRDRIGVFLSLRNVRPSFPLRGKGAGQRMCFVTASVSFYR
jgi:hypothetical protein